MSATQDFYFSEVSHQGWAVPTEKFWSMWHSSERQRLEDMGYTPKSDGESVGAPVEWIVWLPGSRHSVRSPRREAGELRRDIKASSEDKVRRLSEEEVAFLRGVDAEMDAEMSEIETYAEILSVEVFYG